ncbi:ABC transporter permease [Kribbella sp. VKM Ac-2566]|uniref:ABC transporter permease n=1 Tax=Kribbella sp. VKM Ac-2566 TaxID=2512218 RepID=UPI0010634C78|nr:ABC transporter permease [Kribbella sp. VKM Ac-2566]TDW79433.1 peptide/nickel transport system permease protein [Kribbella sp. VKM Ac-2566]
MASLGVISTDPDVGAPAEKGADVAEISQTRLMIRRFRQSKLAVGGGIVLLFLYLVALFAPFVAPNDPAAVDTSAKFAVPTRIVWSGGPAMCALRQEIKDFEYVYTSDCEHPDRLHLFGKGWNYKLFGLIETDRHLFTPGSGKVLIWGGDSSGRDVFARTVKGAQVSLSIGLFGTAIATVLAVIIGTISGYFAGITDTVIQRVIEIVSSVPTLPLWATLAAILPRDMSVPERYFFMSVILSLVGWAGLARALRAKVMSYAGADYVKAARAAGSGHARIIRTHMIPNSLSHIVAVTMLAIPMGIVAETSLSFLGIGMQDPAISWGVLLQDAQDVNVVTSYPWLLIPAFAVIVAVTCFQLLGDGIRDAVDPYG